jgi:hypothetical protein
MRLICFGMLKFLLLAAAAVAQEHSTIYLGTNQGLFRTLDGGNTSEVLETLGAREIFVIAAGPDKTLFAVAADGLFRSTDSGETWTSTNLPLDVRPRVIVFDPETPERVYAGGNGLWRSSDGGSEWIEVPGFEAPISDLIVNPTDPSRMFASTSVGIYRSADRGVSWQLIPNSPPADRMVVAASVPFRLIAGGKQVFLTTDLGDTWLALRIEVGGISWSAGGLSAWGGLDVDVSLNSVRALVVDGAKGELRHIAFEGCLSIQLSIYISGCAPGLLSLTPAWPGAPIFGWHVQSLVDTQGFGVDPRSGRVYAGGNAGLFRAINEWTWETAPAFRSLQVHSVLIQPSR